MNKLLLFLSCIGLVSCQQKDQPTDVAARASGQYTVQSYVVYGDTLYSSSGINKIGVSSFYIVVDRKKPDSVRVGSFYTRPGRPSINALRDVGVSETNGKFYLSTKTDSLSAYESRIDGNVFYERSVGSAIVTWFADVASVKNPTNPALKGVIITAKK